MLENLLKMLQNHWDLSQYSDQQTGWIGAALLAALSVGSAIAAARSQKKQAERTNAANLELAKYGYEQDQLAVDKQNAFNAPEAQMQRYEAAGLNPNLIYGSGSSSAGNQVSTAKFDTPRADLRFNPFQLPDMLSQYQDFQMRQAQTDNVKAQTQNVQERTRTEAMTRFLRDVQGKTGAFQLEQNKYLAPYQAATIGNKARASEAQLQQEWQRLRNMGITEQTQLLDVQAREKNLQSIDLENEKRASEILFNKYRNEWAKEGVTTSDNPILRLLTRMMIQSGIAPSEFVPNFRK